jgi:cysteine desulfurase
MVFCFFVLSGFFTCINCRLMQRIYLDNAATTPMYPEVIQWMSDIMTEEFGNPSSIHFHGRKAKAIVENARKSVAKILQCSIGEIFFSGSATEANNTILKGAAESLGVRRFVVSPTEHPCVLNSLSYLQKKHGAEVLFLPVHASGLPDYTFLEKVLRASGEKTLVSLMHGNNEIGTMTDLQIVGNICSQNHALFHSDTVQTVGKYAIDLSNTKVDFISGSAHKFHGPKGVGFMYIEQENALAPYIHGGAQERNMRAGTENVPGIAGLAKALEISHENREKNQSHILQLREHFKNGMTEKFRDIHFNGEQESGFLAHVLSVSFPPGPKADLLVHNLDIAGISCSSASACSSGVEADSHVLRAIGHDPTRKSIRFSFSSFNTLDEINLVLEKLENLTPAK